MPDWTPLVSNTWRALWIGAPGASAGPSPRRSGYGRAGVERPAPSAFAARAVFDIDDEIARDPDGRPRARAFVASTGRYRLYVNGSVVGEGPEPSLPPTVRYDGYEVGALLRFGRNAVAVLVWPEGLSPPSAIVKAEMHFARSFSRELGSDSQWRARATEWVRPLGDPGEAGEPGEAWDPALAPAGWTEPGFDDSAWPRAEVTGRGPQGSHDLVPREFAPPARERVFPVSCPRESANLGKVKGTAAFLKALAGGLGPRPVDSPGRKRPGGAASGKGKGKGKGGGNRSRARPPVALDASKPGSMPEVVFDFGRLVVGRPAVEVETRDEAGEILVSYGETVDLARRDVVRLSPGAGAWSPLGRRTFRYLGLAARGAPRALRIRSVSAEAERQPAGALRRAQDAGTEPVEGAGAPAPRLECSDRALAGIFGIARATLDAASTDGLDERPGREGTRLTGAGLRAMALATYYLGGDVAALRAGLAELSRGELPGLAGDGAAANRIEGSAPSLHEAAHALSWVVALGEYQAHTGELEAAGELFTAAGRALSVLERFVDRTGALHVPPCEPPPADAALAFAGGGPALSFLMCGAARAAARVARATGRPGEAERLSASASDLVERVRSRFMVDEAGLFAETPRRVPPFHAATNAAAVLWGGLPPEERGTVAGRLAAGATDAPRTPLDAALVAEALLDAAADGAKGAGEEEARAAVDLLRRYFGGMVARGATEFWEAFDPDSPRACLPWAARPYRGPALAYGPAAVCGALLIRYVLGIRIDRDGEGVFLAPGRSPVERAKGSVPVRGASSGAAPPGAGGGQVGFEWRVSRGRLEAKGRLPEGTGATLAVPFARDEAGFVEDHEMLWGRRVFVTSDGRAVLPEEVESAEVTSEEVRLRLRPGAAFNVTRRPAGRP